MSEFRADLERLSRADVARLLAVTTRHIDELTRAGVLPCRREARHVLYTWTEVLAAFLQRTSAKGSVSAALTEKYRVEAERGKIRLAKESREAVATPDVERVVAQLFSGIRSRMLAMPSKLSQKLAGRTAAQAHDVVKREVLECLQGLAAGDVVAEVTRC